MPLAIAPLGKKLLVIKILTDENTKSYFLKLGLTINSVLTILSVDSDNIIALIEQNKIVISKNTATKIIVKE